MPLDASIYQLAGQGVRSPTDYIAANQKQQATALDLLQGKQKADEYTAGIAEKNALRQAMSAGLDPSTPEGRNRVLQVAPTFGPTILDAIQKHITAQSQARHLDAQSAGLTQDQAIKAHEQHVQQLTSVSNPDEAKQWLINGAASKVFTPQQMIDGLQKLQTITDPEAFAQWKEANRMGGMKLVDQMKYTTPDANAVLQANTSTANTAATNATHLKTTQMTNDTSLATNAATNKTHIMTTGMTNATSAANNAATQETAREGHKIQAALAGIDPQTGNFVVGPDGKSQFQSLIEAIGTNQSPQSTVLARVPPGVKAQILGEVKKQYPDYDPAQFAARNRAVLQYTNPDSKSSTQIQATNTALNHLDTMLQLSEAQKNGNYPLFNKLANAWAINNGQVAPKNMRDAALMVGPEISKAVIGAGGGVAERGDFVQSLGGNFAPAQIAGTAATMKELLAGRLSEAKRTYERTTGRKDFEDTMLSDAARATLAKRGQPTSSGGMPDINAIDAEIARRKNK